MREECSRRAFFGAAASVSLVKEAMGETQAAGAGTPVRPLGKTGVKVSVLGLGGHHAARPKEESESFRIIHGAIAEGITFMDNAWEYHDGRAEEVMGKALAMDGKRKQVFLMTKVCDRDYEGAKRHLEDSLKRLRTDVIDLWQFHECNYFSDPQYLLEQGGLKAALEAKKAGKIRFIGFTGHKSPQIHRRMLALDFPWDARQMPNNILDSGFLSFRHEFMPELIKKSVGIVGMKGCTGDQRVLDDKVVTLEECYRYFLSQPVSTQVVGLASVAHLNNAVRMAREFKPMTTAELKTIQQRIRVPMGDGRYELFKTTQRYDSTHHRRQHGFA